MTPTRAELVALFDSYSDEALQQRAQAGVLTELAQQVAEEELRRRGLPLPVRGVAEVLAPPLAAASEPAAASETPAATPVPRLERSQVVRGYLLVGRAEVAQGDALRTLLESHGIPLLLARDYQPGLRLEVPAESAHQARALLARSKARLTPPWSPADWFADRPRLREIAVVGVVLLWGAEDLLIEVLRFLRAALGDPLIDAAAWWPALLPLLTLSAGALLLARSKWTLFVLMTHLLASIALGVLHPSSFTGLYSAIFSAFLIYYAVYLLGQGRLR
ncbi:MAG TPA: hypothetical protein VGN52_06990 [Burkholderiales bacterium]|jgi:hypothetical protein